VKNRGTYKITQSNNSRKNGAKILFSKVTADLTGTPEVKLKEEKYMGNFLRTAITRLINLVLLGIIPDHKVIDVEGLERLSVNRKAVWKC
jgi:hypothetical protein